MATTRIVKQKSSNAAKRKAASEAGRVAKEKYLAAKKKIIQAEEENFKSLYVLNHRWVAKIPGLRDWG